MRIKQHKLSSFLSIFKHCRKNILHVFLLLCCAVLPAQAQQPKIQDTAKESNSTSVTTPEFSDELIEKTLEENDADLLDTIQVQLSKPLMASAKWMDSFLADDEYTAEVNNTFLRLRLGLYTELENSKPKSRSDLSLFLNLPNTEDRMQLVVTSMLDSDDDGLTGVDKAVRDFETQNKAENTVGLRYFLVQGVQNNLGLHAGISFRDDNLELMGQIRYRYKFDITDDWASRFSVRYRQYTARGFETKAALSFERQVGHLFFTTDFENYYEDQNSQFNSNINLRLFQPLNEDQALEYALANGFEHNNDFSSYESIKLSTKFRSRFLKDWLFCEIVPQVSWEKEYDWRTNPGIMFRFEMKFGQKAMDETLNRLVNSQK
ncbi:hypothetical protein D0S45_08815 [Marinifilum sp. JC120]|nr:hypothetical protein D0S45_08815 [Marinifilum sp. JC120]